MTLLATPSNCSNPDAHEDSAPSGIHALAGEFRRILLPRTPVNKDKKESRGNHTQALQEGWQSVAYPRSSLPYSLLLR
jgi:hypothetical protein